MLKVRLLDRLITLTAKLINLLKVAKEKEEALRLTFLQMKRTEIHKEIKELRGSIEDMEDDIEHLYSFDSYVSDLISKTTGSDK